MVKEDSHSFFPGFICGLLPVVSGRLSANSVALWQSPTKSALWWQNVHSLLVPWPPLLQLWPKRSSHPNNLALRGHEPSWLIPSLRLENPLTYHSKLISTTLWSFPAKFHSPRDGSFWNHYSEDADSSSPRSLPYYLYSHLSILFPSYTLSQLFGRSLRAWNNTCDHILVKCLKYIHSNRSGCPNISTVWFFILFKL